METLINTPKTKGVNIYIQCSRLNIYILILIIIVEDIINSNK